MIDKEQRCEFMDIALFIFINYNSILLSYAPSASCAPLDFAHLAERVRQFNNEEIGQEAFMAQLKDRLVSANINQVKNDVLPFVRNPKELNIWSNDYFVQLADMMKFE